MVALLTDFIKETFVFFNKCVDRALNFKEMHFVNNSLSVKYHKAS